MSQMVKLHDLKKTPPPWITYPETKKVLETLRMSGGEGRFVGGCVRDALLGHISDDIDICTDLKPDAVMTAFGNAGVRVIPTGLKHGTVTAILGTHKYEITTLRVDVSTDGRHAEVEFTANWQEDAARRDFTINALYLTEEGELLDYFDGINDLQAGQLRFIGDADARIEEDRLRVLRYFRFFSRFHRGTPDPDAIAACENAVGKLGQLSSERVTREFMLLLEQRNSTDALRLMERSGVLQAVLPGNASLKLYGKLLELPTSSDALQRLCVLYNGNLEWAKNIATYLRLSTRFEARLVLMCAEDLSLLLSTTEQKAELYKLGCEVFKDRVLLAWGRGGHTAICQSYLELAENWQIPKLPVSGKDLLATGMKPGPVVGENLKRLEKDWIASDFLLSKDQLLVRIGSSNS